MTTRRGTRLGIAALAGAVALLALLNLHFLTRPVDISPIAPPPEKAEAPRPDGAELATALDKKMGEQFQETVARPLFNPSRRPVVRKETAAAEPKADANGLRLVGVMRLGNQPPRALIRSADAPTGKWIAEGAQFNGWTLRKVNDRSVIVQSGNRTQELKLSPPRRPPQEVAGPKP